MIIGSKDNDREGLDALIRNLRQTREEMSQRKRALLQAKQLKKSLGKLAAINQTGKQGNINNPNSLKMQTVLNLKPVTSFASYGDEGSEVRRDQHRRNRL